MRISNLRIDPGDLVLDKREVYRYLGYKRLDQVPARTRQLVEESLRTVRPYLEPQAVWRVVEAAGLRSSPLFGDAWAVGLAICTVGQALDDYLHQLFAQGEAVLALVVDAIGSVAAEAVADRVEGQLQAWAAGRNWRITRRFSPGYGSWSVAEQKVIFRHFPPQPAGVRLTGGGMMLPRKSVSFATKMGPLPMEEINPGRCGSCGQQAACPYRDHRLCAS